MKTLGTPRMILRPWEEDDLLDLYEYAKEDDVGINAGWLKHNSIEESKIILDSFIKEKEVYAIVLKEKNKVIGSLGIHHLSLADDEREIGFVLGKPYWNQGLMTEAVKKVIDYVFNETKINILWCSHFSFNHRSQRVIEKSGFSYYNEKMKLIKQIDEVLKVCTYILRREQYLEKSK